MKAKSTKPETTDDYIAGFRPEVQKVLRKVRATVRKAAPGAEEGISYRIPVFRLEGDLVYFAAFKKHIGLYPRVSGIRKLAFQVQKRERLGAVSLGSADSLRAHW